MPEVRGSEGVGEVIVVGSIHDGLLEHFGCDGEFFFWDGEILEDFLGESFGEFAVEFFDEGNSFFSSDVPGADFLGGVVGGAANTEFGVGGVIVEVIDTVVDAVVLGVGAGGSFWRCFESAVFYGVVVAGLRVPFEIVASVVDFNFLFFEFVGIGGEVGLEVVFVEAEVIEQILNGRAADVDFAFIIGGEVGVVSFCGGGVGERVTVFGFVFSVEDEGEIEQGGHFGGQHFLAENEGLEGVEEVFDSESGEESVDSAVGGAEVVVETGMDPGLEVAPSPFGVNVGCPSYGEGMHAVFFFENVGSVETVFSTGAGDETVVGTVFFSESVTEVDEFFFTEIPVD